MKQTDRRTAAGSVSQPPKLLGSRRWVDVATVVLLMFSTSLVIQGSQCAWYTPQTEGERPKASSTQLRKTDTFDELPLSIVYERDDELHPDDEDTSEANNVKVTEEKPPDLASEEENHQTIKKKSPTPRLWKESGGGTTLLPKAKGPPSESPYTNPVYDWLIHAGEADVDPIEGVEDVSAVKDEENRVRFHALPNFGYKSKEEMDNRSARFPSIEKRVRTYMSNWYVPPCESNPDSKIQVDWRNGTTTQGEVQQHFLVREIAQPKQAGEVDYIEQRRVFQIKDDVELNRLVYVEPNKIRKCVEGDFKTYCEATLQTLLPTLERLDAQGETDTIPPILQYGDSESTKGLSAESKEMEIFVNVPVIKKFRRAFPPGAVDKMTEKECNDSPQWVSPPLKGLPMVRFQPIIWKQKIVRHFGVLDKIAHMDIEWDRKIDKAGFRGELTGIMSGNLTLELLHSLPARKKCLAIPRCALVYNNHGSPLVDAMITTRQVGEEFVVPKLVEGTPVYTDIRLSYHELLFFKAIIMPEGNDVSTGLKWALFSNSVVMTPPPTLTAWTMEELLEPWVHYIPLSPDFSDVDEKMQWVLENDEEAHRIAYQGQLWMHDLLFHPDAEKDEHAIFDEIIRRFRRHFVYETIDHSSVWMEHGPNEDKERAVRGRNAT